MKTLRTISLLILAAGLTAGLWWYKSRGRGVAILALKEGPDIGSNTRIPAGKGALEEGGKFVPEPARKSADGIVPLTQTEAEGKLKAALKVEELGGGKFRVGLVDFDQKSRKVSLPARVNMRAGIVEYVLTTESGKRHESMLTTAAAPRDLHMACLLLGMKGAPVTGAGGAAMHVTPAEGAGVLLSWETNGPPAVHTMSSLIHLARGLPGQEVQPMPAGLWHYTGSKFTGPGAFAAQEEGSVISLIRDSSALLNNPGGSRDQDDLHTPNAALLPPEGTPVTLILQLPTLAD